MLKEVDKTSSPRAGRRKLDGSDNFSPSDLIHTKDALHKSAGRFSVQIFDIAKWEQMFYYDLTSKRTESHENC